MLTRDIVINYATDQGHITNIFHDKLGGSLEHFQPAVSSTRMVVDKVDWLQTLKSRPALLMLSNNGRMSQSNVGNDAILLIPNDEIFRPVREAANPMAEEISVVEGRHSISIPIKAFKELLDNAEEHVVRDFKSALSNSAAEATEIITRTSFMGHPKVQATPMRANAMVRYVQSGDYTKPDFDYDSLRDLSETFERSKPWFVAGFIIACAAAVGWCAVKLYEFVKPLIDNHNNNIQKYLDESDNVKVSPEERGIYQVSEEEYARTLEGFNNRQRKSPEEIAQKSGDIGKVS